MAAPELSLSEKMKKAKTICDYEFEGEAEPLLREVLQRGSQYAVIALDGVGAIGRYFDKKASDEGWTEAKRCKRTWDAIRFPYLAEIFMESGLHQCIVSNPEVNDTLDVVRAEYVDGLIGAAYKIYGLEAATTVIDALGINKGLERSTVAENI